MSWLSELFGALFRRRPAPPAPTPAPVGGLLEAVNALRQRAGLGPLTEDGALSRVAAEGAAEMARVGRLNHQRLDGRWPWQIAKDLGYPGDVGEVIAMGQATPGEAVSAWTNDPPHRALLLGVAYRSAGWASADGPGGRVWCLDLGTA